MPFPCQPLRPDRLHINVGDLEDLRIWSKHLGVSPEAIAEVIKKVGNAIPAVRKELGISEPDPEN